VALEPLGPAYSNYLQTIGQAAAFLETCGANNAGTMCDLRHMVASGDALEDVTRFRERILHTHVDYPLGNRRVFPMRDDGYDYTPYLRRIVETKAERLSVEALQETDLSTGRPCVAYLRELLAQAEREVQG